MPDALGICSTDVTLPVVPMFHVNAWGVPYAAAMTGSKLVLPGPCLDPVNLTEMIENEKVTNLLGVPTVWMALLAHARAQGKKFSTVKKVVIGGSACPPSMIQAWETEHGARVLHAWGMTEMSPLGTVNTLLPKHSDLDDAESSRSRPSKAVRSSASICGWWTTTARSSRTTARPQDTCRCAASGSPTRTSSVRRTKRIRTAGSTPATSPPWTVTATSRSPIAART